MAVTLHDIYTFSYGETRSVYTYYDLDISKTETAEHKHVITAYSNSQGQYTDSAKEAYFTLIGVPNLADAEKFLFYEESCKLTQFGGKSVSSSAYLNKGTNVVQLFGRTSTVFDVSRQVAFIATESYGVGSRSRKKIHKLGCFTGNQEYSYNEATRTLVFTYVGVENSPAAYDQITPVSIQFSGRESWVKTWTSTRSYYIAGDSNSLVVHKGKKITAEDLKAINLNIYYDYSATKPKRNGYDWPDGKATLTLKNWFKKVTSDLLVEDVPDSSSFQIGVLGDIDPAGQLFYLTYPTTVVELAALPFQNFAPAVTAYGVGDTIDLNAIANKCAEWEDAVLTYTDGTTIRLSEVELADNSVITATMSVVVGGVTKTSLRTLTIENLVAYGDCHITLTIPTKHFGTLSYTYEAEITTSLAYSLVLNNVKTDFVYGDTAEYGSGATATLYDSTGSEITVSDNSVSALLASGTIRADSKILASQSLTGTSDVMLDGNVGQGLITTTLQNANYYKYLIYVSYCDGFELSQTNLGDFYVDNGVSTSIVSLLSSLTAKYVYHHNTASGSETDEINLEYSDLTASETSITATADQSNYKVELSISPEESPAQTLKKKVSFNVFVNRFVSLEISHTATGNTYYAGRTNTFVLPNDLVVKKVYNNPTLASVALTEDEILSLEFRVAEGTSSTPLVATTSTIPASQNVIYVTLTLTNGTVLQGSYSIAGDYQADTITSFSLEEGFNFTLGNKLSTYKYNGDLVIKAHYASGYVTTDTTDLYSIVQSDGNGGYLDYEKVIMDEVDLATIYVKHNGNYFSIPTNQLITAVVPTGSISISGFQITYVNTVDKIDFRDVVATVTYANTNSATSVEATLNNGNVATASTYALSCTGINSFDGTEAFNVADQGVSFSKTITVSVLNRFDPTVTITATIEVTVISIATLSFTRLVVKNPKTEYKVGDTFLDANDTTLLNLYYEGSSAPVEVYLKDVPTIVGTDPSQGTIFTRTNDSMSVTVRLLADATKYTTYTAKVVSNEVSSTVIIHNIVAAKIDNNVTTGIEELDGTNHYYRNAAGVAVVSGYYILVDSAITEINASGERVIATGINLADQTIYGYLENIFDTSSSATVVLFDDYVPPVEGESNIEVKYPCYVSGNAAKIDKCHIAKMFGNNNAKNRLFLSGNPDFKNCDWHSGAVNEYLQQGEAADANGDFTYFGDMDYCFYGQTDNAIMGYDNVATDKMVVLKSKSKIEPTNYFRSSGLVEALDNGGNKVIGIDGTYLQEESFPLNTGNIGSGAMNFNSIANLNGDTLYLSSENTICGLDIAGQVGDSQRISYSRSRYIDPELKTLDLSDAVLWTDNTVLYLFADNASYMTHYESFNSDTGQYEWWKVNVKGVRCAIDIDGVTYMGSEDGSLYRFEKKTYYDCDKIFIEAGGALYVSLNTLFSDNKIVYAQDMNGEIDPEGDYTFSIKPASLQKSLFRKVAHINNVSEPNADLIIDYDANVLKLMALDSDGKYDPKRHAVLVEELAHEGNFYLNYPDGESTIVAVPGSSLSQYYRSYTIVPSDSAEDSYEVYDGDGNRVALASTVTSNNVTSKISALISADLCKVLDGEYEVFDLDQDDCSFKLRENGRELDIVRYGDQNLSVQTFVSELHKHTPVYSYFIAAPAILGNISYRKTIWAWTLSAFKEANDLQVCQATNEENLENMKALAFADSVPIEFDMKKLSITQMDFEKSVVPRKFTYFRPISVPFISFGFKSDKAVNSILTATSIVYTIPMMGRGNK